MMPARILGSTGGFVDTIDESRLEVGGWTWLAAALALDASKSSNDTGYDIFDDLESGNFWRSSSPVCFRMKISCDFIGLILGHDRRPLAFRYANHNAKNTSIISAPVTVFIPIASGISPKKQTATLMLSILFSPCRLLRKLLLNVRFGIRAVANTGVAITQCNTAPLNICIRI